MDAQVQTGGSTPSPVLIRRIPPRPPSVREAPAFFWRGDGHYLATSGRAGCSQVRLRSRLRTYHGPWKKLGDLNPADRSRSSFNSQISCILRHPGKKGLYSAIIDRWTRPRSGVAVGSGDRSRLVQNAFANSFTNPPQPMTAEEKQSRDVEGGLPVVASQGRHALLPIRFDQERPKLDWIHEWRIEDYD